MLFWFGRSLEGLRLFCSLNIFYVSEGLLEGLRLKSLVLFWFLTDFVGIEAEIFDVVLASEGFWRA